MGKGEEDRKGTQKRDSPGIKGASAPGLEVPKKIRMGRCRTKSIQAEENSAEMG